MSLRKEQEPVESHDSGPLGQRFTHPAFGQISASRVQGDTTLYGSDFVHHHFIIIRIARSELCRDLNHDWHFAGREYVEVALSEAQWATFVSSLNNGSGIPCTVQHVDHEMMPSIPLRRQEDVFKAELHSTLGDAVAKVERTIAAINGDLGQGISGKKREAILAHLDRLRRDLDDSLPFTAKSFEKHMENTVEKAKVEVNAYMQATISRAGLAALGDGAGPLLLESGER